MGSSSDLSAKMSLMPCSFWRGGVCKALIFRKSDLPEDRSSWQPLLAAAMGSPDPDGNQLNGMGGGIPALSKICVVSTSTRPDADVDFEFIQLVVGDGSLDLASNCGNMIAAIGPYALDQNLCQHVVASRQVEKRNSELATVRIFNTNTQRIILSNFPVSGSPVRFHAEGEYMMDGVAGKSSKIALSFMYPGGTQTSGVLPCKHGITVLDTQDKLGRPVRASLVDVANPAVYVDGEEIGLSPHTSTTELRRDTVNMTMLESIRQQGAVKMGLDPNVASVPKVIILFSPSPDALSTGTNIKCLALSMGQPHNAIPLTIALSLGAACRLDGTIAARLARGVTPDSDVVIQHPTGKIDIGVQLNGSEIASASLYSTARLLMQGQVNVK